MIETIDNYIKLSLQYKNNFKNHPENFIENNELILRINNLDNLIQNNFNPLLVYFEIINKEKLLLWEVSLQISFFDESIWKELYTIWYNMDITENFIWEFILKNWWLEYKRWIKEKDVEIQKYNNWKNLNQSEYKKIIHRYVDLIRSFDNI
jgi:hypothetical protein